MAGPQAQHMARAIELSRQAGVVDKSGGCFGAVIVDKEGNVVAEALNTVVADNDPSAHGEVNAIRKACKKLKSPHLTGCTMYTSAEPCPLCTACAMWARIETVYYAAQYSDVKQYGKFEDEDFFAEFQKSNAERTPPSIQFMRDESVEVWKEFAAMPEGDRVHY